MASEDPASDPRASYDYRSDDVERPGLEADLDALVAGDVRLDSYSRQLYATDASAYEVTPIGVVFPRTTDDVARVVSYCADEEIPVLPRGGGTSLAGQTVNEAVVLDFTRYMDEIRAVDPDARLATVEPGTILGRLNERLERHGLTFAPDPAWGDKSAIGGAIGNNSTGAHSLLYGKTDTYVESCEVVLADGTVTRFGEVTVDELCDRGDPVGDLEERIYATVARLVDEEAAAIDAAYPDLKRNVSGYNLDRLIAEARGEPLPGGEETGEAGTINLARLLAGSEGTLAVVTEATVSLEPIPESKSAALLCYRGLHDAMADVAPILEHEPAAVEVLDDVLIGLARETTTFGPATDVLPDGTGATLLVEFYADSAEAAEAAVAGLLTDRCPVVAGAGDAPAGGPRTEAEALAIDAIEAYEAADRKTLWNLRKAGLPILLSRTDDEKHISFVEDTAVPPERLPEFVAGMEAIFDTYDTSASFYAHAGPGVLHVRPLVNTKSEVGVECLYEIADAVTDLVVELGGSVSGEHGDGRARTQWNRKLYGEDVWALFRELKTAFDPDWLLNPGQVCGDVDLREQLRFDPDYEFDAGFEPTLRWETDNGFQGMVELCHGCGGCRGDQSTTGGVMCPTYRASREEITSTRGRANALRAVMSGDLPAEEALSEAFLEEVLDLCIGCNGCAVDCPSEVDMAKLKVELTHAYHQRHGVSLRDRLFANVHTVSAWGSRLAPLSNLVARLPGARRLAERTLGIDADRALPRFHRRTFRDWFRWRGARVPADEARHRAVVYPDTYTNYCSPQVGIAAVRVLEAAGVHVSVPAAIGDSGRPAYSKGLLDLARRRARENVEALTPLVEAGWDVVVVEPSDAAMFQLAYPDLVPDDRTKRLAGSTYEVCEYIDSFGLDDAVAFDAPAADSPALVYHGHCHGHAAGLNHHAANLLRRAGYEVDALDSGCCGMAGSFGYEAEHASMSDAIAALLFEQVEASPGERVVAPGASCRTQFASRADGADTPKTPIEALAARLP